MIIFDRFSFQGPRSAGDALHIPGWARAEHLEQIAPQAELWRYR